MSVSGKMIRVGDIEIYCEIRGEGYPLLMIMGLSANADWWSPELLDSLAENFKVITFDNRGSGRSSKAGGPYSIDLFVEDTIGLMDELGIEQAHVAGVSMGGMVAQKMILDHTSRVNRLVLCVTSVGGTEAVIDPAVAAELVKVSQLSGDELEEQTVNILFPEHFIRNHPQAVEQFRARYRQHPIPFDCYMHQLGAIMNFSTFTRLGEIKAPVLVVTGSEDILIPPENSKILADNIDGAKLVVIEGAGHGLTVQKDDFLPPVLSFLKG